MPSIFEITQLTTQELIYQFFLPFILIYTIFFAVLQMMHLFGKKTNLILSLGITIMVTISPVFSTLSIWISQFGAYTALLAFAIIFVVGIGAHTFRRSREYVTGTPEELQSLENEIKKLRKKMERESDTRKRMALAYEIAEKERIFLTLKTSRR